MTNTDNDIVSGNKRERRCSRRNNGYVTLVVLFFLLVFAVAMSSLASLTTTQLRNSRQGLVRAKALTLAEAGVDDASQRLNPDLGGNFLYGGTDSNTGANPKESTLNEATNVPFGTFWTKVTPISAWRRRVVSVGTSADKGTLTLTAIIEIGRLGLGEDKAAIKSNGTIDINGTADITTIPLGGHFANVMANGTVSTGGSSVIDGGISSFTSVTGSNGYVPNVKLETKLAFLTDAMVAEMKTDFIAKAKAGGTINNNFSRNDKIVGSKYVEGNIKMTGSDVLTLSGGANSVVYVNGDVDLSGGTLVNGVTLVVAGTFTQTGQSVYKIVPGLPTPTLFVYNQNNVGTGISLRGGGLNDSQGIVYGVKGDVNVAGGSTITGAIYAGDPNAGVKSTGNFTLKYADGQKSPIEQPTSAFVTQLFEL